jgi:hypothetical protein
MNTIYELHLRGYDSSTDETDYLIKWIEAPAEAAVWIYATNKGWRPDVVIEHTHPEDVGWGSGLDAIVDADGEPLQEHVKSSDVLFGDLKYLKLRSPIDNGIISERHRAYDKTNPDNNVLPEPHNVGRAAKVVNSLAIYAEINFSKNFEDEEAETVISDFVCDLQHVCRMSGVSFAEVIRRAESHFEAESDDGG